MKFLTVLIIGLSFLLPINTMSTELKKVDIGELISKEEFSLYKDVGDFIEHSPKVTIIVEPDLADIREYGSDVVKSITGSDCDRDGKMDDNAMCNAIYYKLWMRYER